LAVGGWFDDGLKIKPVCARDDMLSFTAGSGGSGVRPKARCDQDESFALKVVV
jgi:hypothetical protein